MRNLLIILLITLTFGCAPKQQERELPNVLLIVTDDQGFGDTGYNGNTILETPVIDQLAAQSVIFDRFYVSPVCAPTRASLLTGKYHLSTGVSWVTHRKEVMRKEELTIAEYLKEKGYVTGLFGKWHNGAQYPHDPTGQGFESFIGFKEGHFNNYFDPVLFDGLQERTFEGYLPDIVTDEAINMMEQTEKPFFTMLAYNTPHSPFQVPDRFFDKYKSKGLDDRLAAIYGMIENLDENIGRLIESLRKSGKLDNTVIFFVGDNGPNGRRYNRQLKGIKSHVDEGGVRVPALLSYPAKGWNTGETVQSMAAHIDLLPTIAGLLGDKGLPEVDGVNLAGIIDGTQITRPFFTHQVVREFDRYPGAVREGDYLLTVQRGNNELYNLSDDESQLKNLSDSLIDLTTTLRAKYEQWIDQSIAELGDPQLAETGHGAIEKVVFQAQEISAKVDVGFEGKEGWSNDYLINFTETSIIEWQTKTVAEMPYVLQLELHADPGTEIRLEVNQNQGVETAGASVSYRVENSLEKTLIPSPDRVLRGEVYAYEWPIARLGIVTLKKGVNYFRLTTKNAQNLQIKSLQLIKDNNE